VVLVKQTWTKGNNMSLDNDMAAVKQQLLDHERRMDESHADRVALHETLNAVNANLVHLNTVLEQMEKKMCQAPNTCMALSERFSSVEKKVERIKGAAWIIGILWIVLMGSDGMLALLKHFGNGN